MKKIYMKPCTEVVKLTGRVSVLAGSPKGFNNNPDNDDPITPEEMLSRRYRTVWDDDEGEEDFE